MIPELDQAQQCVLPQQRRMSATYTLVHVVLAHDDRQISFVLGRRVNLGDGNFDR